ncbi:MAG: AmmeMemoRadiSam system radical SAM enzyme [Deltaproteobacteria bacterium]|nr:AmmeMemoRadiSam system radical SAM enzyme [Deltaproteobacteria bacterium]
MQEAALYSKNPDKSVKCFLCRHNCRIKRGARGLCMVRENIDGTLYSIFYGKPCAIAIDPIEKKPLFHYFPGTKSFSIATMGCNFQCEFCQNWDISQYGRSGQLSAVSDQTEKIRDVLPEEIVQGAVENNCKSISYTYSEPTIFYEYARDIAKIAAPLGIKNIFVTNGFMTREMLDEAKNWLDAVNVDLKAFKNETYRKVMKADLNGVLDSIAYIKKLGIWMEITTLIVPQMNDDKKELEEIANFIASVGNDIPWHISRFHPQYKMSDKPATPEDTMQMAYEIGKKAGLKYVYMGNIPGHESESTFCWKCGEKLIERFGYNIGFNKIDAGKSCPKCKVKIDGIF